MAAFIEAFIASNRRPRYRALGGVPLEKLCHDLEHDLDRRFVVEVPPHARGMVGPLLGAMTKKRDCMCLTRWPECQGEAVPINQAIQAPDDALCLIEAGRIAYYLSEWSGGDGPAYLLLRDEAMRRDAAAAVAATRSVPRKRRR